MVDLFFPDVHTSMRIQVQTAARKQKGISMFLKEISSSQAQRDINKLFASAYRHPTLLTRQNKEAVVVMSKARYAKLIKSSDAAKGK